MCVITAYGVQCLVARCRGSGAGHQAVSPGRGGDAAASPPLPGLTACCAVPDPRQRATKNCTP
jgi:hypothetical protein